MIRGIFIPQDFNEKAVERTLELGADVVFVGHKKLNISSVGRLRRSGVKVFAAIGVFGGSCPGDQKVWREKLNEIKDTILKFEVGGVFLDSIRFPTHWEVPDPKLLDHLHCPVCVEKFKTNVGLRDPKSRAWVEWKCEQITDFVAEAAKIVKNSKRGIELGLFAVPWTDEDFDGAITKIIGQNFKNLSKHVDVFSPMTYHKMCGRPVSWIADTVQYFCRLTGKPVLPLVQTENKPTKISPGEFRQSLEAAIQKPSEGVIVFFLEDLLTQSEKLDVVMGVSLKKKGGVGSLTCDLKSRAALCIL